MIALKQVSDMYNTKNNENKLIAKNVKLTIYIKPSDVNFIQELYNVRTKGMYKKRCIVNIREMGDTIILGRPEEILNKLKESNQIGYGRGKHN